MPDKKNKPDISPIKSAHKQILLSARDLFMRHLGEQLPDCINHAIEMIRKQSYTDHVSYHQNRYSESEELLRDQSQKLVQQVKTGFARRFDRVLSVENGTDESAFQNLELVSDENLERQILLDTIASRLASKNRKGISLLLQRITFLAGVKFSDAEDPFGPRAIVETIEKVVSELDIHATLIMIVLRAFERKLDADLPEMYRQLNDLMIRKNILPDIVWEAPKPKREKLVPQSEAKSIEQAKGDLEHAGVDSLPNKNIATLEELLRNIARAKGYMSAEHDPGAASYGTPVKGGGGGTVGSGTVSGQNAAFGGIQQNVADNAPGDSESKPDQSDSSVVAFEPVSDPSADDSDRTAESSEVSVEVLLGLLDSMEVLSDTGSTGPLSEQVAEFVEREKLGFIPETQRNMLGMVDALFVALQHTHALDHADSIMPSVSKLKSSLARMAICEPDFIHMQYHPVRRMFGELSSLLWLNESNNKDFRQRIEQELNEVACQLDLGAAPDRKKQSREYAKLLTTVERGKVKVRRRERALVQFETGKCELSGAVKFITEFLKSRFDEASMSNEFSSFLRMVWHRLLLRCYLLRETDQSQWNAVSDLTQRLPKLFSPGASNSSASNSGDPEDSEDQGADRLLVEIGNLLEKHGLKDQRSYRLLNQLANQIGYGALFHLRFGNTEASLLNEGPVDSESQQCFKPEFFEGFSLSRESRPSYHLWQDHLAVGSWVELQHESWNLESRRCRLLAVIQPQEICLFVDGAGYKVATLHSEEVNKALEENRITVLEDRSIFDLAIEHLALPA